MSPLAQQIILALSVACTLIACLCLRKSNSTSRWIFVLALIAIATTINVHSYWVTAIEYRSNGSVNSAIDAITSHINDEEVQYCQSHIVPGPKDEPEDRNVPEVEDKRRYASRYDRSQAKRIIVDICTGNIDDLADTLNEYEDKPFALTKVCHLVSHCFRLAGSKHRLLGYANFMELEKKELQDNDELILTWLINEAPVAKLRTKITVEDKDGKENDHWSYDPTNLITARGALVSLSDQIIADVNRHKTYAGNLSSLFSLVLALGFACTFIACICLRKSNSTNRYVFVLTLLAIATTISFVNYHRAITDTHHKQYQEINSAITSICSHLADKDAQYFTVEVAFGAKDEHPNSWADDRNVGIVTDAEREQAEKIITAMCTGNLSLMQSILDEYEDKPYASAKMGCLINYCLYASGSKYSWFSLGYYMDYSQADPGVENELLLMMYVKKPAAVLKQVRVVEETNDGKENENWCSAETDLATAKGVFVSIAERIVSNVNHHTRKAIK
jgi:uncharacterized membrane protein YedE/YeeE